MAARLNQRSAPRRRFGLLLLVGAVSLLHLYVALTVADSMAGFGDAKTAPKRMQAAFVRELVAEPPPTVAPTPAVRKSRPTRKRRPAEPALAAASEPLATAGDATSHAAALATGDIAPLDAAPPPQAAASAVADASPSAATPDPAASAAAATSAAMSAPSAKAATSFEWPASTRLNYSLTGYYRGAVQGSAQVQWVHSGDRYQVQMDVVVGLDFAPLMTRRIVSDGVVSDTGLAPRRFDEETRRAFIEPRRNTLTFEPGEVVLANGQRRAIPPGVQDAASQFVQLTWLFTRQPHLLTPGKTVEIPLALPRSLDRWLYDVVGEATLAAPFGPIQAIHLKPRREARSGDLTAEMWIAPTLQYLPVRILIRQDAETFVDLMIERPPLQAERE